MKKRFPITALFLLLVFMTACSTSSPDNLKGTVWELVSYGTLDVEVQAAPGIDTRLEFGADGTVSGSMGCNHFSGTYRIKNGAITFGPLAATEMACPDPQMTQESAAFQVLSGTVSYRMEGDALILSGANSPYALTLVRK